MTIALLREKDDARPKRGSDPASEKDPTVASARRIRCRHCGEPIAERDAQATRHVFANPAGRVFEILKVRKAQLDPWGVPTEEHTWFPGFAWRAGTCPRCRFHLGWIFDPVQQGLCFCGLITGEIEES